MFLARRPDPTVVEAFLADQARSSLTYSPVGLSESHPPGFNHDRLREVIGQGEAAFQAATTALEEWSQFAFGWIEVFPPKAPLEVGTHVAVLASHLGFWSLNACRVVEEFNEEGARFGFAYGTLAEHAESGEERFIVERDTDGSVWYEIRATSRPQALLARLGYPISRRLQASFRHASARAMKRAVEAAG
jgi:uncharacterized protein (UPF0548 family)